MNHQSSPKPASMRLTRREALRQALGGCLASAALPLVGTAAPSPQSVSEEKFVPENDYPFFGPEPTTLFPGACPDILR